MLDRSAICVDAGSIASSVNGLGREELNGPSHGTTYYSPPESVHGFSQEVYSGQCPPPSKLLGRASPANSLILNPQCPDRKLKGRQI